jgi:hypothetical protein
VNYKEALIIIRNEQRELSLNQVQLNGALTKAIDALRIVIAQEELMGITDRPSAAWMALSGDEQKAAIEFAKRSVARRKP